LDAAVEPDKRILSADPHLGHGEDAPRVSTRALVSGLSEAACLESWLAVATIIQMVTDESGHGQIGPDQAFIFAGFVGPVPHWERFSHEFTRLLKRNPAMSPREFKTQVRRENPDERVLRSVQMISDCSLHGFRFKIAHDDFLKLQALAYRIVPTDERFFFRNQYFIAFVSTLLILMAGARHSSEYKVQFIYDEEMHEERKLKAGYKLFRDWAKRTKPEILDYLYRNPFPQPDAAFHPLLMADALVYHSYKAHVAAAHGRRHINPLWESLQGVEFYADEVWDDNDLSGLINRVKGRP
jgi:hypothetical protein